MHLNPFRHGETLTAFTPPEKTREPLTLEEFAKVMGNAASAGFFGAGLGVSFVERGGAVGSTLMAVGVLGAVCVAKIHEGDNNGQE